MTISNQFVFEEIYDGGGDTSGDDTGGDDTTLELDTTLTVAGKAADAKAVGDAIDEVVTQFEETEQKAETNRTNISSLDSRVTELEESEIELDTSLTQAGKAADAKAVGDAIENAIANAGGGGSSTANRPCLLNNANIWEEVIDAFNYYLSTSTAIIFTHGEDNCNLLSYEYSGNALSALYFIAPSGKKLIKVTTEDGTDLVVTENDIVDSDGTTIELDTTLTQDGKAADAKAVGDALGEKVNVADIVDNDYSVHKDKPLSANQGSQLSERITQLDYKSLDNVNCFDFASSPTENMDIDVDGIRYDYANTQIAVGLQNEVLYSGSIHNKVPIVAGEGVTFEADHDNQVIKINATGGGAGITTTQISITYAELKALRDTAKLIPGMFYRITDYVCTTIQPDTRAMGNKFDIIVQALSTNTLSENAKADYHAEGGGFKSEFLADEDGALVEGAVVAAYYINEDFAGIDEAGQIEGYKSEDGFVAYGYSENNEGVIVPVIYKTDTQGAIDSPDEFGNPDYADTFYYVGDTEVDGVTYNKWRKINSAEDGPTWEDEGKIYALTNVIVEGGSATDGYFKNANLPAWELKYCFDNDTTRFAWAVDSDVSITRVYNYEDYFVEPMVRSPEDDGQEPDGSEYQIAWRATTIYGDPTVMYSLTEAVRVGDLLYFGGELNEILEVSKIDNSGGKGVIYYMKDEHGNECPYDFKNIQFKRTISLENGYPKLDEENGEETWVYTFCGNSYHIDNDEWSELKDGSLESPYGHQSDENTSTFHHNVMKPYILLYDTENEDYAVCGKQYLNNNVFFGYWEEVGSTNGEYPYYYAYCCHNNTFGNLCNNNTFGNLCGYNTFDTGCCSIKIEIDGIINIHICKGVSSKTLTPEPNANYEQIYRKSGRKEILI